MHIGTWLTLAVHSLVLTFSFWTGSEDEVVCATPFKQVERNVKHQYGNSFLFWGSFVTCQVLLKIWQTWHSTNFAGFGCFLQEESHKGDALLHFLSPLLGGMQKWVVDTYTSTSEKVNLSLIFFFFLIECRMQKGSSTSNRIGNALLSPLFYIEESLFCAQ